MNTYSTLKQSIADWMARDDLTSFVDGFIDIAEARVNMRLRLRSMESTFAITVGTGDGYGDLPANWAGFKSVQWSDDLSRPIEFVTKQQLATLSMDAPGRPRYFSIADDRVIFEREADADYILFGVMSTKFTALSDSNTSNWLTTNAPQVLLYGALAEAAKLLPPAQASAIVVTGSITLVGQVLKLKQVEAEQDA